MQKIVFLLYDGVRNSVFQSQVLKPLLDDLEKNINMQISIVSFEKSIPSPNDIENLFGKHDRLNFIFFTRQSFYGRYSLIAAIYKIKNILKSNQVNQIIARGPLAGYITLKALSKLNFNTPVLIQARGLCAQEYRYAHKSDRNILKQIINKFIIKSFNNIENYVYNSWTAKTFNLKIEAVSPALKDYLIHVFHAEPSKIVIATKDIPKSIDKCQAVAWKSRTRDELGIPEDAIVYCYSGSFKPWQCASQTIESFSFQYFKNSKSFMLILTQDKDVFKAELNKFKIPSGNYKIVSVNPDDILRYLCAADFGMLLREQDVINWVSRPTKMLEYQACGLKIVHNNTIAWLAKN
jgi:hypothetical protein